MWLASGNILAWLSTIDPGLTGVLQQQVATVYGKKDYEKLKDLIGSGIFFSVMLLILVMCFGLIFSIFLPQLLDLEIMESNIIILETFRLAVFGTAFMLFSFAIKSINIGLQGILFVGICDVFVSTIAIALCVLFLHLGYGLNSIAYSILFSGLTFSLLHGFYLLQRIYFEKIGFNISLKNIKMLSQYLSYTFFSRTLGIVANNVDLIIVSRILGPENVALLALTRKSCDMSRELINQPAVAFQPTVSHAKGAGDIKKLRTVLIRLITILIWLLFLIVGGLITFNKFFVSIWVGEQFYAGNSINFFICVSVVFAMTYNVLSQLCFALGNIKGTSVVEAIQSLLFIPIAFLSTKYFGVLGTVIATIIPIILVSLWYFPTKFKQLLNLSKEDVMHLFKQIGLSVLILMLLVPVFTLFEPSNISSFLICCLSFSISYLSILFLVSKSFKGEAKLFLLKFYHNFRKTFLI